jgi:leukotriene-A4 hydrolase
MRHTVTALFLGLAALALSGCATAPLPAAPQSAGHMVARFLDTADAVDPYSFARPSEARVTHVALDLTLDFDRRTVAGSAKLDILTGPETPVDVMPDHAGRETGNGAAQRDVILDTDGLTIDRVTDAAGARLPWRLGATQPDKGAPLVVTIGDARQIVVHYSAANAAALQWLTPDQTAGGRHPYLLSQGQPILNRSWIPTQDSPGIRQTWEAVVRAPAPLTVVMSGERLTPTGEPATNGMRAFRFRMDQPVAPYLIAIAAGDIAFRSLGPRTGVWTESVMMDRAAAELADTERMVDAAEALYGPYRWGRFDVIVLPPSFPFGGMENPTLTFLTPTFIAGDKSLVGLVAHELAHSWSGNLVTNANWSDSWLNEGFTSYFENRIMESLYGVRRARQEAALSFAEMEGALTELGADSGITRLHLTGADADPNGGNSGIIYDKGAIFLRTLEQRVGRERWDIYLRSWFDRNAFSPATSAMFLADIREHLVRGDAATEADLLLDQWVYQPGLPVNVARPDPAAFATVDRAVAAYAATGIADPSAWANWTTAERLRFLNNIPRTRTVAQLAALDADLRLSHVSHSNNETLFAWLDLALANRYEPALPVADRFLRDVGRRKFVLPLFRTLMATDWGQPHARRIYTEARAGYHSVTTTSVDAVVTPL